MTAADVVISHIPTRTYTVPAALTASVGKRATLDTVYDVLHSGTDDSKAWAEKIINGIERERGRQDQAVLASIGYDPEVFTYWGLTDGAEDDLIRTLGRTKLDDTNIEKSETLAEDGSWRPVSDDISQTTTHHGVAMEPTLLAFTASAFMEGCNAVLLAYGEPHCFLEEAPMLAAGTPSKPNADGNVYAVVDSTDTTAVMDVIMIKPGPEAYRRDGGAWVLDNATLDALLSATPPPIVELQGDTLSSVLQQVDGNQSNQIAPTDTGQGEAGEMLEAEPIERKPLEQKSTSSTTPTASEKIASPKPSATPSKDTYSSNQNKSQLKDGSSVTAAILARYEELETLISDVNAMSPVVASSFNLSASKRALLEEAAARRRQLCARQAQIENILLPALLADAQSMHDATPNQRKATHLRKYWVRGAGAVKIKWGTAGDFTRCERQLKKYLGERAKGYCAKRHKETVGYWPGDKRNTGPNKGNTGQKSFN